MDSNHRPHDYQSCALASWAIGPYQLTSFWWRLAGSNRWPPACKAGALPAELNPHISSPVCKVHFFLYPLNWITKSSNTLYWPIGRYRRNLISSEVSLERRWSSRTFRYGYLVTTSPQLPDPPSAAPSLRLDYGLRVFPTLMVWRAVCTRPGNVFTAAFWSAITSNSSFMQASCSLQSELRWLLGICSTSRLCFPLFSTIVLRV